MKTDTPKCHIFIMEIMAYSKNFQLAHHVVIQVKVAIYLPGPFKDKGFSGLALDMQHNCVNQTFVFRVFQICSACAIQTP